MAEVLNLHVFVFLCVFWSFTSENQCLGWGGAGMGWGSFFLLPHSLLCHSKNIPFRPSPAVLFGAWLELFTWQAVNQKQKREILLEILGLHDAQIIRGECEEGAGLMDRSGVGCGVMLL